MYKEIHPLYRDNTKEMSSIRNGDERPVADFYIEKPPILLDIHIIRMMREECVPDGSAKLYRISVSKDSYDDIVIREEEALQIRAVLLKHGSGNPLVNAIEALTSAIRDLWNLLRARMR